MKKVKYRIVTDKYAGFECQKWRWYFPFWCQMGVINTFRDIDKAKQFILKDQKSQVIVWEN